MKKNIAVIPGDGIGPEIVKEAVKVLKALKKNISTHLRIQRYVQEDAPLTSMENHFQKKAYRLV